MTEKEVEKAYKKMTESDAPDLWAKIESNLPEKEVRTEKKVRTGFFAKLGKIFSGGSTWKTSAAVCAVCIIVLGTAQGAAGMFRAGSSMRRLQQHQKAVTPWMPIRQAGQRSIQQRPMVQKLHRLTITA